MNTIKEILDYDFYKKMFQKLTNITLRQVAESRTVALDYARKGIEQQESSNLTAERIERMAEEMQKVAKMVLEERSKGSN